MSEDKALDQNEIERLLGGMGGGVAPSTPAVEPAPVASGDNVTISQSELDALFAAGPTDSVLPLEPKKEEPPPSSSSTLSQAELDALLGGGSAPKPEPKKPEPPISVRESAVPPLAQAPQVRVAVPAAPVADFDANEEDENGLLRGDVDYLLKHADETLRSVAAMPLDLPAEIIEFQYPEFGGTVPGTEHATLDQISEVELDVKIELGRTNMYLEDILKLRKGSVVPLDKLAGESVDIFINGRLLARGEVLVMNENFCVRVAELLAGAIPME
ncbi:MAG: flagellar motor switch protein FliN, partial [Planctomycetaceae bacterium]|jgi:flagellar motor switch protein FliN/FliY|nr:flagellar motor switch protein FliN [Planctomycetaceae bacterium]